LRSTDYLETKGLILSRKRELKVGGGSRGRGIRREQIFRANHNSSRGESSFQTKKRKKGEITHTRKS